MGICVIFNPAAGGEKAKLLRNHLQALGGECALKATDAPGAGRRLATQAILEGFETIVAAGGDGTINEVLNGMGDAPDGFARARMGILAVGTVNVFAREIGLPLRLGPAWQCILRSREMSIDIGRMEFENDGRREARFFVQMAGCGWDARAVDLVSWELKKRIGQFAYMIAGLKALRGKLPLITARNGAESFRGKLVVLGNGRYYGGQIPIFHRANNHDGLLDVCVFPTIGWSLLFRYCLGFLSPRLYRPGSEFYCQTSNLRLESDEPVPLQLEGELVGQLPASCSVLRQSLRVIIP